MSPLHKSRCVARINTARTLHPIPHNSRHTARHVCVPQMAAAHDAVERAVDPAVDPAVEFNRDTEVRQLHQDPRTLHPIPHNSRHTARHVVCHRWLAAQSTVLETRG